MFGALTTAATGMEAQQILIDIIANNLSNVNTTGFKKSRADFQDLLYTTVRVAGTSTSAGNENPTGFQIGQGTRAIATQKVFSNGQFKNTQNPLDVAIEGPGFFQVTMPDGTTNFTRNGSLKTDSTGRLVDSNGHPLDPAITIPSDATSITIGEDGTMSVMQAGQTESQEIGQLQLAIFVNSAGLEAMGNGMYRQTTASGSPIQVVPGEEGAGSLAQGALETSNVKVVEEMIEMITGQRAYELNSKVIQTADNMMRQATNLRG